MDQPFYFSRSFSYQQSSAAPGRARPRASSDLQRATPPEIIPQHANPRNFLKRTSTFGGFYLSERREIPSPQLSRFSSLTKVSEEEKAHVEHSEEVYESSPKTEESRSNEETEFPEGGFQAWKVVLGSWCCMFVSFGLLNSTGFFEAYLSEHQLKDSSSSKNGWIFSVFAFLLFFGGVEVGHLFDSYGPRWLIMAGSLLMLASLFTIGIYTAWWHFFLGFSVVGGIGASLLVNPAMGAISHWFLHRRGLAVGLATTAGSCGGILFPLLLDALTIKIGFAWATRIIGFICVVFLIFGNLLTKSRLPRHTGTRQLPNLSMLKDADFAMTTFGVFFIEVALFVPLTYISTYAISIGMSPSLAFQLLAILNAGSFFGRWLPGVLADKYGRYNLMCFTLFWCMLLTFGLWLPEIRSTALIIVFAFFFGVSSGGNISLVSPCLGQLAPPEKLAEYFSCCYAIVAFGSLVGIPIAGSILSASKDSFRGLILFTSLSYLMAFTFFSIVRVRKVGWKFTAFF